MTRTTYYLSGPMRGMPDHGIPEFFAAAAYIRAGLEDVTVISPAEMSLARVGWHDGEPWDAYLLALELVSRETLLRADISAVTRSDAVVVLSGWEQSEGALFEVDVARRLGIPILGYPSLRPIAPAARATSIPQDGAMKADDGKVPLDLLPAKPLWGIARVLGFGAGKYEPHNWRKGFRWGRVYAAMQRHLTAWIDGEDNDPETGASHLWHAGCDLLFLIEFEMTGTGTDDRYKRMTDVSALPDIDPVTGKERR